MFEILDDRRLDLPAAWGPEPRNHRARSCTNKVTIPAEGEGLASNPAAVLQLFGERRGGGGE
ncbi:hypothetical protein CCMA1212_006019 [Trichoderma ghanense]|uniref:Uncharacterized protein n=1 Tax=Trichoderma ghanense TaxID=65468 RepID=A0ABY2H3F5_9HYPO